MASSRPVSSRALRSRCLYGFTSVKFERIGGAQPGVDQLVARLEQHRDAIARAELEVVLALGADVQIGFEIRLVDGLAAAGAFHPQALGAHVLGARFAAIRGQRRVGPPYRQAPRNTRRSRA